MKHVLAVLCLFVLACANRGPKSQQIPHGYALRWNEPMRGEVVKVWDGLHYSRDPKVTHLIEVRLEDAPAKFEGQVICFPYDSWSSGKEPPNEGETVVFMPSQWVQVDPRSMGRPR